MDLVALEALGAAATAIQETGGVIQCSLDGDHKGGEIIFTTVVGNQFVLRLEALDDDEEYDD